MVDRCLSTNFGVKPLEDFREKRLTDDGRPHHHSSSVVQKHKVDIKRKTIVWSYCVYLRFHNTSMWL